MFIHDPLYKWMLSPLQAIKRQRLDAYDPVSTTDAADAAERAARAARASGSAAGVVGRRPSTSTSGASGGGAEGGEEGEERNASMREAAERTLARIKQKLQGLSPSALSSHPAAFNNNYNNKHREM